MVRFRQGFLEWQAPMCQDLVHAHTAVLRPHVRILQRGLRSARDGA
jgi:hypothetical protein